MSAASLLDQVLEPLSRCLDAESAQRLLEFGISPAVQERVDFLAEHANEGLLTEEERAEYEALINAADLISILKLKARQQLSWREPFPEPEGPAAVRVIAAPQ